MVHAVYVEMGDIDLVHRFFSLDCFQLWSQSEEGMYQIFSPSLSLQSFAARDRWVRVYEPAIWHGKRREGGWIGFLFPLTPGL